MKRVEPAPTIRPMMYAIRILFIRQPYHIPPSCLLFFYANLTIVCKSL
jgi:hypothetical protein